MFLSLRSFNLYVIGFVDWILSTRNYLFSPIRCATFFEYFSFVFTYPDFKTNLEFGFRCQLLHIAIWIEYTVLSFFLLLASTGVILMELCLTLLYWSSIFGSMSKYTKKLANMAEGTASSDAITKHQLDTAMIDKTW